MPDEYRNKETIQQKLDSAWFDYNKRAPYGALFMYFDLIYLLTEMLVSSAAGAFTIIFPVVLLTDISYPVLKLEHVVNE